jgi:hypothetical protein
MRASRISISRLARSSTLSPACAIRWKKKQGAFRNAFYSPFPNTVFTVLGLGPSPNYDKTRTDKAVSGTLGIQYRPVDDVMLYATYNRGFKAGGVNIDANAAGTLFNNPTVFNALPPQLQGLIRLISPTSTVSTPLDPTYKPEKVNAYEVGAQVPVPEPARGPTSRCSTTTCPISRSRNSWGCASPCSTRSRPRTMASKSRTCSSFPTA